MQTATQRKSQEKSTSAFSSSAHHQRRFLSDVEIEAVYGIPRKTLRTWRLLGKGPIYRKFGRSVKYKISDFEEFVESLPTGGAGVPSSALR